MAKKAAVDRKRFPHTYVGETTRWGLVEGTPCRIVGRRAGGTRIVVEGGKRFVVGTGQVQRA